ncbi:cyclin [Penicillium riverlandense]|uniref:cyclin n=1 Tax=Penicillium riverlandense TaxID=1903569 RepID=UPI002546AF04|nr:cyclin [Penicillium riverlandense]KAJ5811370.1 cyclin [Penicillium riverlandense]
MDFYLRCNSLKCRTQLKERAVVTTCSHIFCLPCADSLGLSHPTAGHRRCPACQTVLLNPDDAVSTVLNPTEDYKTSVLSGLDPGTIVECAGRALGFWSYQTTQEIFYQEFLGKALTEKYSSLSTQMDKVIHNANTEISSLQSKFAGQQHCPQPTEVTLTPRPDMQARQDELHKKNQELAELYREKSKKLSQMTNLYNLLKARAMHSQMQTAASSSVSQTLHSLDRSSRSGPPPVAPGPPPMPTVSSSIPHRSLTPAYPVTTDGVEQLHRYQRSGTGSSKRVRTKDVDAVAVAMPPPTGRLPWNTRNRHRSPEKVASSAKPQHRTRLPGPSRPPTALSQFPGGEAILERFGG